MSEISFEEIEKFLEGRNNDKYIVAVEGNYYSNHIDVIYNHPTKGKYIKQEPYTPFIYFNDDIIPILYGGNKGKINQERINNKIKIKRLKTTNEDGETPSRIENGYKYIAHCSISYNVLLKFFKNGGVDVFSEKYKSCFVNARPEEQFLIQTGKRLFKGIDDYDELHRFQFDLETTGIDPSTNSIFQIGVKDNKGFEYIIDIDGEDDIEKRKNEVKAIKDFFKVIDTIQPDLITGYNSENFDWDFFFKRCERLNINIKDIATTLNPRSKIRRKENTLKLGSKNEKYMQTYMWGYNVLDISHAVRQAKAINSDIKKWSLKYITVYAEAEKENRVYVKGNKLYEIWSDKINDYAFNDNNGKWYIINEEKELKDDYKKVSGKYVVERYLKDDLWETNKVDEIFNQAVFLLAKLLPTSFQRTYTMGTAGKWGLIMLAWSYEQGIAIPSLEEKKDFTGGLARLVEVGFAEDVAKLDFAALYPNIEITWDIIPDLDISNVMKGLLLYIAETRDKYKLLKLESEEKGDFKTANVYDKKQLPLKILANSFFGAFGASYLYHWGDLKCAEETTCRGRQYLRLMVKHFHEKYGFRPLVGDTDGFNFAIPKTVNNISYNVKGTHRLTERYKNQTLTGLDAVVAEFNEEYMIGRMGLDVDDVCNSTINFKRKNYANLIVKTSKDGKTKEKIKIVGVTIKADNLPTYQEEFINKSMELLLNNRGYDFINLYNKTVEDIYNYRIPLVNLASKSKVNDTIETYNKKMLTTNKAGNPQAKQAHMELILKDDLKVNLGDVIYYVNIGTVKSHPDIKTITNKETGERHVNFNCVRISNSVYEKNIDILNDIKELEGKLTLIDDEFSKDYINIENKIDELKSELYVEKYNVAKYVDLFNKRMQNLLVCFSPEIRSKILRNVVKNKSTKELELEPKTIFKSEDCKLVAGYPLESKDQDDYNEKLMKMEDKEIKFWTTYNMTPNNINLEEWETIKKDYFIRKENEEKEDIEKQIERVDKVIKDLDENELNELLNEAKLPLTLKTFAKLDVIDINDETVVGIISKKYNILLMNLDDVLKMQI